MRIGFFVWEYPPRIVGGLGTYAENVCPRFVERGHDVSLFTMNDGNLKTREVMRGVEVHRPFIVDASEILPLFVTEDLRKWGGQIKFFNDVLIYNFLSATKFVNDLIKKEGYKFDIISAHDWLSAIAGIASKKATGLPFVFHVHSTEWGRALDEGSKFVTHLEETAARVADKVITVSYPMQEDLVRHGWDPDKISVCWNGVDIEKYNPTRFSEEDKLRLRERYGISPDDKMLLFVGRLTAVKGVINLIQAMPHVLKELPDAKLVILGAGELANAVVDLIKGLGVGHAVRTCFKFVPEEERILHYAACDVAVFPSVYEPFGIVCTEAMAMAKPVVVGASGINGFRDQVVPSGEEQTGVHIDGRNPADIAWGINVVLSDPEKAKKMGKNGRKRVEKYFTWDRVVDRTLEIYEEVIKG